ncbi:MAG: BrnT family toxin [Pyrinomonadaceae bacterium]
MKIADIIWLTRFVDKIERKHNVSTDEVEQVFENHVLAQLIERGDVIGEHLYRAIGQTYAGRYLTIFFIYKGQGGALIISARDANKRERKSYGKHKK